MEVIDKKDKSQENVNQQDIAERLRKVEETQEKILALLENKVEKKSSFNFSSFKKYINKKTLPYIGGVSLIIIVAIFLHISFSNHTSHPSYSNPSPSPSLVPSINYSSDYVPLPQNLLDKINNFPSSLLIQVAKEMMNGSLLVSINPTTYGAIGVFTQTPSPYTVHLPSPLTYDGKILFYLLSQTSCQFSARTSWSEAIALSQFGKFTSLYEAHSINDGNYPYLAFSDNITTIPGEQPQYSEYEYGDSYQSSSVEFQNLELQSYDNMGFYGPLVSPMNSSFPTSREVFSAIEKYIPSIISSGSFGTPILQYGNIITNGAPYDDPIPRLNFSQLISELYSPTNSTMEMWQQSVLAGADMYIADLCYVGAKSPICSEYNWTAFYDKFG